MKVSQIRVPRAEKEDRAPIGTVIGASLGLFVESLNDVIDLHTKRITVGLQYKIPGRIWFGLYTITLLSMMAIGHQFSMHRGTYFKISIILGLTFSMVILLIADLDRAAQGTLKVSQVPMLELQKNFQNDQ